MEEAVHRLDERIAREIRQEKSAREKADAETVEEIHGLEEAIARLKELVEKHGQEVRWLGEHPAITGRPRER